MKTIIFTTMLFMSFLAKAETYFVDYLLPTHGTNIVSVKIDEKGKGFKEFENEIDLGGGKKYKTGFMKISSFTTKEDNTVSLTVTVRRNSLTYQKVKNIENCPVITTQENEIPINIGYNSWTVLSDLSEKSEFRVRVRKLN